LDQHARISTDLQLVRTAREVPTLIVVAPSAPEDRVKILRAAGCEVWCNPASGSHDELLAMAAEMARRGWTNVLLESGPTLLGAFHDAGLIDEVHVFIAPKIVGGATAPAAIGGIGITPMTSALPLENPRWQIVDGDAYVTGYVDRSRTTAIDSTTQA
jgi:diaminohydroxyphosphoribosylaminopyrimidine deaminase/5-amino-6-(5-phosphoribosylamino)uracil reductase